MPSPVILATMGPGELLGLILDTTFFGKTILLVLLVLSLTSWAVFIDKARTLGRIRQVKGTVHGEQNKEEVTPVKGDADQEEQFSKGQHLPFAVPVASHHGEHHHEGEVTEVEVFREGNPVPLLTQIKTRMALEQGGFKGSNGLGQSPVPEGRSQELDLFVQQRKEQDRIPVVQKLP